MKYFDTHCVLGLSYNRRIGKKFSSEHGGGGSYWCGSVLLCVRPGTVHVEFKRVSTLYNAHH